MIEVTQFDSPLGTIAVAERKKKVLAVTYGGLRALKTRHPTLWKLEAVVDNPNAPSAERIRQYLSGQGTSLKVPVDTHLIRGDFDRKVLVRLAQLKPGKTVGYGELARWVGSPQGARAVGGAMRRNPIPIVLPCHRVLPQSGALGNYTGGVEKKEWLLEREGVTFS